MLIKSKKRNGLISDYIIALNFIKNLIYRNSSTLKCIILTKKERKICIIQKNVVLLQRNNSDLVSEQSYQLTILFN